MAADRRSQNLRQPIVRGGVPSWRMRTAAAIRGAFAIPVTCSPLALRARLSTQIAALSRVAVGSASVSTGRACSRSSRLAEEKRSPWRGEPRIKGARRDLAVPHDANLLPAQRQRNREIASPARDVRHHGRHSGMIRMRSEIDAITTLRPEKFVRHQFGMRTRGLPDERAEPRCEKVYPGPPARGIQSAKPVPPSSSGIPSSPHCRNLSRRKRSARGVSSGSVLLDGSSVMRA
jgi:hypothetical protein